MYKTNKKKMLNISAGLILVVSMTLTLAGENHADSEEFSARDFVFEEDTNHFAARFTLQHIKNGKAKEVALTHRFKTGDKFRFMIRPNQKAFIYVVNITPQGKIKLVWPPPNKLKTTDNRVYPNQSNAIPQNGRFKFERKTGDDWMLVVLSREKRRPDLNPYLNDLPKYRKNPGQVFEYKNQVENEAIPDFNPRGRVALTDIPQLDDPGTYGAQKGEDDITLVYPYLLKHKSK